MSENPEYRHEKSENGVINNTDNDPELEPEIESHEQNVSHLLFFNRPPEAFAVGPEILRLFKNSLEIIFRDAVAIVHLAYHAVSPPEAVTFVVDVYLLLNVSFDCYYTTVLFKLHVTYLTSWI